MIQVQGSLVLIFENLHAFDSWSWKLLVRAAQKLQHDCLMVVTTRPIASSASAKPSSFSVVSFAGQRAAELSTAHELLLQISTTLHIKLKPLSSKQAC